MEIHAFDTGTDRVSPPTPGLVVGEVSTGWIVERISVDHTGILGIPAADAVGTSILRYVHPGDVPDLRVTAQAALADGTSAAVVLKLGAPGRWEPVQMVLTPMVDGALGFTIGAVRSDDVHARTARLEQHLWRIAREIESAGVLLAQETAPDLTAFPRLAELSPRQWEVLRRLLQGERVPGIARHLYLSPSTVRNHLTAIFAKVGVHSQEELIDLLTRPATHHQPLEMSDA